LEGEHCLVSVGEGVTCWMTMMGVLRLECHNTMTGMEVAPIPPSDACSDECE